MAVCRLVFHTRKRPWAHRPAKLLWAAEIVSMGTEGRAPCISQSNQSWHAVLSAKEACLDVNTIFPGRQVH